MATQSIPSRRPEKPIPGAINQDMQRPLDEKRCAEYYRRAVFQAPRSTGSRPSQEPCASSPSPVPNSSWPTHLRRSLSSVVQAPPTASQPGRHTAHPAIRFDVTRLSQRLQPEAHFAGTASEYPIGPRISSTQCPPRPCRTRALHIDPRPQIRAHRQSEYPARKRGQFKF